ncbi:hypothetical protein BH18ACT1_BH18ACT1_08930 [soil metagenome]
MGLGELNGLLEVAKGSEGAGKYFVGRITPR